MTTRVAVLESKPCNLQSAERWLLQDAHNLALARRGYSQDTKGRMVQFDPNDAASIVKHYEAVLSRAVNTLIDAATADGLGLTL